MTQSLNIGKITRPHGLNGEVKVFPLTEDPKRFEVVGTVYLDEALTKPLKIKSVKYQAKVVILKFEGISRIEEVEKYKNQPLYIDINAPKSPLEEDEYYTQDLIGLSVVDEALGFVGTVKDIIGYKAHDVMEIEEGDQTWFLPFVEAFIVDVDMEESKIFVKLIEGMRP